MAESYGYQVGASEMHQVDSNYPLKDIPQPHPHDVLCGRGGGTNSHIGNTQWRALVQDNKRLYLTLPKKQKMLLSQSIVISIRSQSPPGRFLIKDSTTDLWYDVGDHRATEKTSQALREGAPSLQENLGAAPKSIGDDDASRPSDAPSASTSSKATNQAAALPGPVVGLEYMSCMPLVGTLGTAAASDPVLPPVIAPVAPQGPVSARRPRGQPREAAPWLEEALLPIAPQSLDPFPVESTTSAAPLPWHEDVEPPAPLDPDQIFSFGSIHLSDAEHARLLHNYSLGSAQDPPGAYVATAGGESAASRRAVQCGDPVLQQYREQHQADYDDYEDAGDNTNGNHASYSHAKSSVLSTVPLPVSRGLEPAGLSMGSVMSFGTTMSDIDPDLLTKLEPTGVSFGSVRELPNEEVPQGDYRRANHSSSADAPAPPVDYGLEAVGTSFGSMSLAVDSFAPEPTSEAATYEVPRIILCKAESRQKFLECELQPICLCKAVSSGNLLECSDTDEEEESSHRQPSLLGGAGAAGGSGSGSGGGLPGGPSQSAGYAQLKAALEALNYVDLAASTSAMYSTASKLMPPPPPHPNGSIPGSCPPPPPPPPPPQHYPVHDDVYVNEAGDRPFEIPTTAFDHGCNEVVAAELRVSTQCSEFDFAESQPTTPFVGGVQGCDLVPSSTEQQSKDILSQNRDCSSKVHEPLTHDADPLKPLTIPRQVQVPHYPMAPQSSVPTSVPGAYRVGPGNHGLTRVNRYGLTHPYEPNGRDGEPYRDIDQNQVPFSPLVGDSADLVVAIGVDANHFAVVAPEVPLIHADVHKVPVAVGQLIASAPHSRSRYRMPFAGGAWKRKRRGRATTSFTQFESRTVTTNPYPILRTCRRSSFAEDRAAEPEDRNLASYLVQAADAHSNHQAFRHRTVAVEAFAQSLSLRESPWTTPSVENRGPSWCSAGSMIVPSLGSSCVGNDTSTTQTSVSNEKAGNGRDLVGNQDSEADRGANKGSDDGNAANDVEGHEGSDHLQDAHGEVDNKDCQDDAGNNNDNNNNNNDHNDDGKEGGKGDNGNDDDKTNSNNNDRSDGDRNDEEEGKNGGHDGGDDGEDDGDGDDDGDDEDDQDEIKNGDEEDNNSEDDRNCEGTSGNDDGEDFSSGENDDDAAEDDAGIQVEAVARRRLPWTRGPIKFIQHIKLKLKSRSSAEIQRLPPGAYRVEPDAEVSGSEVITARSRQRRIISAFRRRRRALLRLGVPPIDVREAEKGVEVCEAFLPSVPIESETTAQNQLVTASRDLAPSLRSRRRMRGVHGFDDTRQRHSVPGFGKKVTALSVTQILVCDTRTGECGASSGFVLDKRQGLVVTAAHLLLGHVDETTSKLNADRELLVAVPYENGGEVHFPYKAELLSCDFQKDACVLRILRSTPFSLSVQELKLSDQWHLEDPVRLCGFNQGGDGIYEPYTILNSQMDVLFGFISMRCVYSQRAEEARPFGASEYFPLEEIAVSGLTPAVKGHSGGPCVDASGKVVGILCRTDVAYGTRWYITPCSQFRPLIDKANTMLSTVVRSE